MRLHQFVVTLSLIVLLAPFAKAAGTVQLELVGGRSTAGAFQDWAKALDKGGIPGVRIRSGGEDELNPGIETAGTPDRPVYNITGVVLSHDEILLPGRRYKRSEISQLKLWMDDLAHNGLPDKRPAKVVFGLTQPQYDEVRKMLAKPFDFKTQGLARNEAIEKLSKLLAMPLKFEDGSMRELGDGKIEDELGDLTSGTALAALLRPAGFCMIPKIFRRIDDASRQKNQTPELKKSGRSARSRRNRRWNYCLRWLRFVRSIFKTFGGDRDYGNRQAAQSRCFTTAWDLRSTRSIRLKRRSRCRNRRLPTAWP